MIEARKSRRLAWIPALIPAAMFVLVLLSDSGFEEVLLHLFGGFGFFLRDNLLKASTDSATWVPGLTAFGMAVLIAHRMFRPWASKGNRPWSFMTTFCIVLIVPTLFAIAFIVPGVLLQLDSFRDVKWFQRQSHTNGGDFLETTEDQPETTIDRAQRQRGPVIRDR